MAIESIDDCVNALEECSDLLSELGTTIAEAAKDDNLTEDCDEITDKLNDVWEWMKLKGYYQS